MTERVLRESCSAYDCAGQSTARSSALGRCSALDTRQFSAEGERFAQADSLVGALEFVARCGATLACSARRKAFNALLVAKALVVSWRLIEPNARSHEALAQCRPGPRSGTVYNTKPTE